LGSNAARRQPCGRTSRKDYSGEQGLHSCLAKNCSGYIHSDEKGKLRSGEMPKNEKEREFVIVDKKAANNGNT